MNGANSGYRSQVESLVNELDGRIEKIDGEIGEIKTKFKTEYPAFFLRQAKKHGYGGEDPNHFKRTPSVDEACGLWLKLYGLGFSNVFEDGDVFYFAGGTRDYLSKDKELEKFWDSTGLDKLASLERGKQKLQGSISKTLASSRPKLRPKEELDIIFNLSHGDKEKLIDGVLGFQKIDGMEWRGKKKYNYYTDEESNEEFHDSWLYGKTPYFVIDRILKNLHLGKNDVFYDLGSGYGQVVNYVALRTNVRKAVGIELAPWRVEWSNRMAKKVGLKNVKFRASNILKADYSDGTVFFIFNPFSVDVLGKVGRRLSTMKGRKIVSLGPSCWYFDTMPWAKKIKDIENEKSYDLSVYNIV